MLTDREFAAAVIVTLAAVIGVLMWIGDRQYRRHREREREQRGRAALQRSMRTAPRHDPAVSLDEADDWLMTDAIEQARGQDDLDALIRATREDPPQNLAWPPGTWPAAAEEPIPYRLETERADWALWAAEVQGSEEGQP
jgi:flagellar biosynthesis/type III secretory pathway M-ring protein FliF/YscJ